MPPHLIFSFAGERITREIRSIKERVEAGGHSYFKTGYRV